MSSSDATRKGSATTGASSSGGLGLSTPLVTIQSPGSITHGVSVPAGDNHPLAAMEQPVVVMTAGGAGIARPPPHTAPTPAPPAVPQAATPARFLSNTPSTTTSGNHPMAQVVPTPVSPTKSLEALADQFLAESSYRTEHFGLPPLLRPISLPQEEPIQRLRTLVDRRAWGDVLKVSTTLLTDVNDPHAAVYASLVEWPATTTASTDSSDLPPTPKQDEAPENDFSPELQQETVEILALKCHAWLKLRRYQDLSAEVERWNFVQDNDSTAESPAWIPWSLHILAAQTQQYSENPKRASDVLYSLLQRIPKSEPIWLASVNVALSNYFLRQSEWRLALGSMDQLLELIPAACEYEVNTKFRHVPYDRQHVLSVIASAYRCEVLSRQGRTLMHIGALPEAEERFGTAKMDWISLNQAGPISPDLEDVQIVQIIPPLLDVNQGLLYFANGTYEQALGCFKRATDLLRTTQGTTTLAPKYRMEDWVGPNVATPEAPHALFTECINNMALSALYTCRMNEAVKLMEGLVREDPTAFLTERLAFNLCTLYELGYDSAASARKKRVLLLIGKRFFLHDVGPESFRVT